MSEKVKKTGDVMNFRETMDYIGCSRDILTELVHQRGLPCQRLRNLYFFSRKSVEKWLNSPMPTTSKPSEFRLRIVWDEASEERNPPEILDHIIESAWEKCSIAAFGLLAKIVWKSRPGRLFRGSELLATGYFFDGGIISLYEKGANCAAACRSAKKLTALGFLKEYKFGGEYGRTIFQVLEPKETTEDAPLFD